MRTKFFLVIFVAISPSHGFIDDINNFDFANLKPREIYSQETTDLYLTRLEKILWQENPEFGKPLYKTLKTFFTELNTVMDNDGLTEEEKEEKVLREVVPRWSIPIRDGIERLPYQIQQKVDRAFHDADEALDEKLKRLDTEIDEILYSDEL